MDNCTKLNVFVNRLSKIGITVELMSNYPWIYLISINGKPVSEKFMAEHGFTLAFAPIRAGQDIQFTSISEIFKLIRKYKYHAL